MAVAFPSSSEAGREFKDLGNQVSVITVCAHGSVSSSLNCSCPIEIESETGTEGSKASGTNSELRGKGHGVSSLMSRHIWNHIWSGLTAELSWRCEIHGSAQSSYSSDFGSAPPGTAPGIQPSESPNIPQGLQKRATQRGEDRQTDRQTDEPQEQQLQEPRREWASRGRQRRVGGAGHSTKGQRDTATTRGWHLGPLRGAGQCCCGAFSSRCHRPWAGPAAGWTWPPSS